MPGKKRRASDGLGGLAPEGAWRAVEAGDDFLLGAEEYGFMGLEELDPRALPAGVLDTLNAAVAGGDGADDDDAPAKPSKRRKADAAPPPGGGAPDVAALQAQLAALKAENRALKKEKKGAGKEHDGDAAQPAAGKEKKKMKKKATKAEKSAAAPADAPPPPDVDMSAWDDLQLAPPILAALARLGFTAPTHVQAECVPAAARDRRDVIGAAQTGSGKTLAFGLPILQLLLAERAEREAAGAAADGADGARPLKALVLAPTRELAMQVCDHLQAVARPAGVWVVPIVGGISVQKQERLLAKRPEVVVATPGRLWDLMREGAPHVARLGGLRFLVIDEADRMVQQGQGGELAHIVASIPHGRAKAPMRTGGDDARAGGRRARGDEEEAPPDDAAAEPRGGGPPPPRLQTFVFSATLTLPADLRRRLRRGGGGASGSATLDAMMDCVPLQPPPARPKVVDLTGERRLADRVAEAVLHCPERERDEYLYAFLAAHPGRAVVFANAVSAVRRLAALLKLLGLPAQPLHAGMQQRARLRCLDRFRADAGGVLVATDVAARGLDVRDVRSVVHYQLPASADVYVHRCGRTARGLDAEGLALALVAPADAARWRALLRALGREGAPPPEFPADGALMPEARRRVRLAVRLDEATRARSKSAADAAWRRHAAEGLDLELSDEGASDGEDAAAAGRRGRGRTGRGAQHEETRETAALRAELAAALAEPLQPRMSKKFFTGGAAAGVAAALQAQQPGGAPAPTSKKARAKAEAAEAAAAPAATDAALTSAAVAMARRLADSRGAGAQPSAPKARGRKAAKDPRAAALAAELRKRAARKAGGKQRRLVVVPPPFGRDAHGPDALAALRARLAA